MAIQNNIEFLVKIFLFSLFNAVFAVFLLFRFYVYNSQFSKKARENLKYVNRTFVTLKGNKTSINVFDYFTIQDLLGNPVGFWPFL